RRPVHPRCGRGEGVPLPALVEPGVLKLATPPTAATVKLPERVPPAGFVPIATLTLPVKPGTVLPNASCAVTSTAGVIVAPAIVFVGCTVKASRVAVPLVTLKGVLVAALSPVAVAERA